MLAVLSTQMLKRCDCGLGIGNRSLTQPLPGVYETRVRIEDHVDEVANITFRRDGQPAVTTSKLRALFELDSLVHP